MDDVDDLVLDNIIRFCTEKTRARLACVSKRHKIAVRRVNRMHGTGIVLTEDTYHQKIKWVRTYVDRVHSLACTRVPLYRLPAQSMSNLRSLRLSRVDVNIRNLLAIKHLPLRRLDVSCLSRCYFQVDCFRVSTFGHVEHVNICFDESWNYVEIDDPGIMKSLVVWCRPGTWSRQPYVSVDHIGGLERLSIRSMNCMYIGGDIESRLRHVYVRCEKARHIRSLCRLLGSSTRSVEFDVPSAHLWTSDIFTVATHAEDVRINAYSVMHDITIQSVDLTIFSHMYEAHPSIPRPNVLISPKITVSNEIGRIDTE